MADNLNPICYALVSKKAADTFEEDDSTNSESEVPTNSENQAENFVKHDNKKRNRRNKARKAAAAAAAKALAEAEAKNVMGENIKSSEIEKPQETKENDSTNPMSEIPINSENQTEYVVKYKKRNRRCNAKMAAAAKAIAEAVVETVLNEHNESLVIDEPH